MKERPWLMFAIGFCGMQILQSIPSCTAADQQKAQAALDKANQTIEQVCAERAATKDGGAPVVVSVDAGK